MPVATPKETTETERPTMRKWEAAVRGFNFALTINQAVRDSSSAEEFQGRIVALLADDTYKDLAEKLRYMDMAVQNIQEIMPFLALRGLQLMSESPDAHFLEDVLAEMATSLPPSVFVENDSKMVA